MACPCWVSLSHFPMMSSMNASRRLYKCKNNRRQVYETSGETLQLLFIPPCCVRIVACGMHQTLFVRQTHASVMCVCECLQKFVVPEVLCQFLLCWYMVPHGNQYICVCQIVNHIKLWMKLYLCTCVVACMAIWTNVHDLGTGVQISCGSEAHNNNMRERLFKQCVCFTQIAQKVPFCLRTSGLI